jgi:hypothetical protein
VPPGEKTKLSFSMIDTIFQVTNNTQQALAVLILKAALTVELIDSEILSARFNVDALSAYFSAEDSEPLVSLSVASVPDMLFASPTPV